jgi:glycosyltransferase involved in cell wall biosynthesis
MNNVIVRGFIDQPALFAAVAEHDCLLLPSRFDAFGMVVPEAMGVGVPALLSDRVGAKCIIEQHPRAGWIVPCEKSAIMAKVIELIHNPESLADASVAARAAAEDYSWESYRRRVAQILQDIYASRRAGHSR